MSLAQVFAPFAEGSPVAVMFRGLLEFTFADDLIDRIFAEHAVQQRQRELLFSSVVGLLASVVLRQQKSLNTAYLAHMHELGVSAKSVYNKLAKAEPNVVEELVRVTAARLFEVSAEWAPLAQPLPGYEVLIVDGNHLPASQARLKATRDTKAAPLPGQALVVLDAQRLLVRNVVLCEDAHANERSLLPRLFGDLRPGQCWIADRNFCTRGFLEAIADHGAHFLVRHHLGGCAWVPQGEEKAGGEITTGTVSEQAVTITRTDDQPWTLRRISVQLHEPTRDGDREIHILSNLPETVPAAEIAQQYSGRWTIENAFQDTAVSLAGEMNTLAYPRAALLALSLALLTLNVLNTLKAAIMQVHGPALAEATNELREKAKAAQDTARPARPVRPLKLSTYYLADEIAQTMRGMELAIPAAEWRKAFGKLTPFQTSQLLLELAKNVSWRRFLTNPWTRKPSQRKAKARRVPHQHQSTHKTLSNAKR